MVVFLKFGWRAGGAGKIRFLDTDESQSAAAGREKCMVLCCVGPLGSVSRPVREIIRGWRDWLIHFRFVRVKTCSYFPESGGLDQEQDKIWTSSNWWTSDFCHAHWPKVPPPLAKAVRCPRVRTFDTMPTSAGAGSGGGGDGASTDGFTVGRRCRRSRHHRGCGVSLRCRRSRHRCHLRPLPGPFLHVHPRPPHVASGQKRRGSGGRRGCSHVGSRERGKRCEQSGRVRRSRRPHHHGTATLNVAKATSPFGLRRERERCASVCGSQVIYTDACNKGGGTIGTPLWY